jgi:hypothetical protein
MVISDLNYLEAVSEAPSIIGGGYISVRNVNGKASIKTKGFKSVKKRIIKNKAGKVVSISVIAGSSATYSGNKRAANKAIADVNKLLDDLF